MLTDYERELVKEIVGEAIKLPDSFPVERIKILAAILLAPPKEYTDGSQQHEPPLL